MGLFSGLANLPGVKQLLQFDANNIYQASNAASHLLGNNFLGHLADYGTREGQANKANPARQLRKGTQFAAKYYLGQGIAQMFGGLGAGAEAGTEAGTEAGASSNAVTADQMRSWYPTGGAPEAATEADWLGTGSAAGGATGDVMRDWGTDRSKDYPGSDQWSPDSGGSSETKTTGEKSLMKDIGRSVAVGAGTNLLTQAMSPKPKQPEATKPTPMPDPAAQEQAARRKRIEQLARRGRAASILTDPGY